MLPTLNLLDSFGRRHSRFPPSAKCAKDGAAIVLVLPARSKTWANRPAVPNGSIRWKACATSRLAGNSARFPQCSFRNIRLTFVYVQIWHDEERAKTECSFSITSPAELEMFASRVKQVFVLAASYPPLQRAQGRGILCRGAADQPALR
jgi:hypothetical protein